MYKSHIANIPKSRGRFNSRGVFILNDKQEPRGSGGSGSYYKLTNAIGIKVNEYNSPWSTVKSLKKSAAWKKSIREMNCLNKAKSRMKRIPRGYKVVPVKHKQEYTVGLLMQHIDGVTLYKSRKRYTTQANILYSLSIQLEEVGIIHNDFGSVNVMVTYDNRYIPIDFDAYHVKIKPIKKKK